MTQELPGEFETLAISQEGGVVFAAISAPPMISLDRNWSATWFH
jgi:hypothetical protein